jgi:type IV pilus assembly protein PilW
MMVGVALGLFIVAGATTVVTSQLVDTRRLVVEAQVQQDLRATSDMMTRVLRRSGYWNNNAGDNSANAVWTPALGSSANPNSTVTVVPNNEVDVAWSGANVQGFRITGAPVGVLQMKDGLGGWQDLTDKATLNVTALTLSMVAIAPPPVPAAAPAMQAMACPALCADGTTACWPTVQPREIQMTITGQSISDASVVRSVVSNVRLRNDQILNNTGGPALCP